MVDQQVSWKYHL